MIKMTPCGDESHCNGEGCKAWNYGDFPKNCCDYARQREEREAAAKRVVTDEEVFKFLFRTDPLESIINGPWPEEVQEHIWAQRWRMMTMRENGHEFALQFPNFRFMFERTKEAHGS